jgi:hypothetical protein
MNESWHTVLCLPTCPNYWILVPSALRTMIWSSIAWSAFKARTQGSHKVTNISMQDAQWSFAQVKSHSQLMQGTYSWSHAQPTSQRILQGASDRRLIQLLYFLHAQRRVQKERGSWLISRSTLILFTRTVPHTKSKGLLIDVPFYSYTFTRTAQRTKSKGLPIDVPFLLL